MDDRTEDTPIMAEEGPVLEDSCVNNAVSNSNHEGATVALAALPDRESSEVESSDAAIVGAEIGESEEVGTTGLDPVAGPDLLEITMDSLKHNWDTLKGLDSSQNIERALMGIKGSIEWLEVEKSAGVQ